MTLFIFITNNSFIDIFPCQGYRRVQAKTTIPIAGGECSFMRLPTPMMMMMMLVMILMMISMMMIVIKRLPPPIMILIVILMLCDVSQYSNGPIFRYGFRDLIASPGGPSVSIAQVYNKFM